jgi:hypothetical protein
VGERPRFFARGTGAYRVTAGSVLGGENGWLAPFGTDPAAPAPLPGVPPLGGVPSKGTLTLARQSGRSLGFVLPEEDAGHLGGR